jgi:hypothetical protein
MTADDVVTAAVRGLELGEFVCAPGVEDANLLDQVFAADLTRHVPPSESPEPCREVQLASHLMSRPTKTGTTTATTPKWSTPMWPE